MTNTSVTLYSHFSVVNRKTGLERWVQKFADPEMKSKSTLQAAGLIVKDMGSYLASLNPVHVSCKANEEVLAGYRIFVQTALKNPWIDGAFQETAEAETVTKRAWQAITDEVTYEAGRLVEVHGQGLPGKLQLLKNLKEIAVAGLLCDSFSKVCAD